MAVILSISSHVVRGHVGNCAAVPALGALGHEVWALATVTLAHHKGHDRAVPQLTTPPSFIEDTIVQLGRRGTLGEIDAVLVGYLATADQARAVEAALERVIAANPSTLVMIDPIIGDNGALYVDAAVAEDIRDRLMARAHIITPNAFELGWLAGAPVSTIGEAIAAARRLGARECLVTSAPGAGEGAIRNLLVGGKEAFACDTPNIAHQVHGAGDLLAALYLGHRLPGAAPDAATAMATGALETVLLETARLGADELALAGAADQLRAGQPAAILRL